MQAVATRTPLAVVVSVAGEVDASNEGAFEQLLGDMAASTAAPRSFVVDVRAIDFLACCALNIVAQQARRCRDRGVALCLVSTQPVVARLVEACGLRRVLPIYPMIDEAVDHATAHSLGWRKQRW